jgi:hypothetical protein
MHSSNTCDIYEGFYIGCKSTAESFLFLFTVSLLPLPRAPYTLSYSASPTLSCNNQHHTYGYVTCSKVNVAKKNSGMSSDVTILQLGAQGHKIIK